MRYGPRSPVESKTSSSGCGHMVRSLVAFQKPLACALRTVFGYLSHKEVTLTSTTKDSKLKSSECKRLSYFHNCFIMMPTKVQIVEARFCRAAKSVIYEVRSVLAAAWDTCSWLQHKDKGAGNTLFGPVCGQCRHPTQGCFSVWPIPCGRW